MFLGWTHEGARCQTNGGVGLRRLGNCDDYNSGHDTHTNLTPLEQDSGSICFAFQNSMAKKEALDGQRRKYCVYLNKDA